MSQSDLRCPRDKTMLHEIKAGDAWIDRCPKCTGAFFDQGELFAALGTTSDPSYWDRPETGGVTRTGGVPCCRCESDMVLQDVAYGGEKVEIDRCGHCGGLWLDGGEADKIMRIGAQMQPVVEEERSKAQADLDRMTEPDFRAGGLLYRFLSLFKKKKG
jgi:Zn-finger nucleic acid-binding protein